MELEGPERQMAESTDQVLSRPVQTSFDFTYSCRVPCTIPGLGISRGVAATVVQGASQWP